MRHRQRGRGVADQLARVIRLEGITGVVHRAHLARDDQAHAYFEIGITHQAIGLGDDEPQLAVSIGALRYGLQGVASLHQIAADAGGRVAAVDGLEAGVIRAGAQHHAGGQVVEVDRWVGVRAAGLGKAVAAKDLAVGHDLACDAGRCIGIARALLQDDAIGVVDKASGHAAFVIAGDADQVAVDVVAAGGGFMNEIAQ